MFELLLLVYLAFRNSARAKLKGLNGFLWAGITVFAFLAMFIVGSLIVVFNFCADAVNIEALSSVDPKVRALANKQLMDVLSTNPLHLFTIEMFGIGGYLIVRYLLERKPNKKQPEIHWMDKLGENR